MMNEHLTTRLVWPTTEEDICEVMAAAMLDLDHRVDNQMDRITHCPVPDAWYLNKRVYEKMRLEHDVYDSFLILKDSLLQAVKHDNPDWVIHFDKVPPIDGWDPYKELFRKLNIESQPTPMPGRYLLIPICKTKQITVIGGLR